VWFIFLPPHLFSFKNNSGAAIAKEMLLFYVKWVFHCKSLAAGGVCDGAGIKYKLMHFMVYF
jgi:hypothetical protein